MDEKGQKAENSEEKSEELMHSFKGKEPTSSILSMKALIVVLIAVVLGVGTGFVMAKGGGGTSKILDKTGMTSESSVEKGKSYGSDDKKLYSDSATGTVKKGGVGVDGAFHLERPGGDSQTVAMTSSVVDLSQFVDHKVKVWGSTQTEQVAGWLMDVGRVEVLE